MKLAVSATCQSAVADPGTERRRVQFIAIRTCAESRVRLVLGELLASRRSDVRGKHLHAGAVHRSEGLS